jgi:hypothetical protein
MGAPFNASLLKNAQGRVKVFFNSNFFLCALAMSSSFCFEEQANVLSIMSVQPTEIFWGPMDCPGIIFDVSMLGVVMGSLSNDIVLYLKHNPTYRLILYTHTKSLAEGHLLALRLNLTVYGTRQYGTRDPDS